MHNPFNKYLGEEDKLQNQVVNYLRLKYKINPIPLNVESNKTPFERFKYKTLGGHRGIPDLFIPIPKRNYNGMFLELKKEGVAIYKKNGQLRKSEHLQIQADYLADLNNSGYFTTFAVGYDKTIELIDWYLN